MRNKEFPLPICSIHEDIQSRLSLSSLYDCITDMLISRLACVTGGAGEPWEYLLYERHSTSVASRSRTTKRVNKVSHSPLRSEVGSLIMLMSDQRLLELPDP